MSMRSPEQQQRARIFGVLFALTLITAIAAGRQLAPAEARPPSNRPKRTTQSAPNPASYAVAPRAGKSADGG